MNQGNQIGKNLSLIVFAGMVLLCAAAYILYVYLQGQGYAIGDDRFIRNFGGWLGMAGLSVLVLVYARTAFKLLVRKDSFWKASNRSTSIMQGSRRHRGKSCFT
jgi:hypothetical protein